MARGVKAKRDALIKLLREVQVDCFRQVVEDERIRQESQSKLDKLPDGSFARNLPKSGVDFF